MLQLLGLDATCESVYRAMLAHPAEGVTALTERLKLSEEQVRSALDRLSELALLRPSHEESGALRAVSPDIGMEMLLARQQADLAIQAQRIEESRAAAARLIADYADLRPAAGGPDVEQLVGLDAIRDRLATLTRRVSTEVMTFAPDGAHAEQAIIAAKPLDLQLLERGVLMRTVYLDAVRNDAPTTAYLGWLAENGGHVRTTPSLPVRMIITDRRTAIIPVDADSTARGAVVLHGHGTVTALCALFDAVWTNASPLGQDRQRDQRGLTAQEREALRLLANGCTDETVAKRLGISARSARRIAADLMETLGARSRFQGGVLAVQNGLLPPKE